MNTDDLIHSLGQDATLVSRHAIERRLAVGLLAGGLATLALIAIDLGFRHDLATAMTGGIFWMKAGYTAAIAACAIAATVHLARPEAARARQLWMVAIPVALLAALAMTELAHTPASDMRALFEGRSWTRCSIYIATLSIPIFAGLIWAFRRLAPTRLRLTGAAAGLAAGASAATLYCLHCPEASATFVFVWYSLGIVIATAAGALLGPRLLRW